MAMIACRECKAEVSDDASICPTCGADDPSLVMHWVKTLFGVLLALALAAYLLHKWLN
jgi:RNA polymerase subunit RPABC4/transcription elongation factor Spt4